MKEALKKFESDGHKASEISGVGITNQRETTVVWDPDTGKPCYNAIVWSDTRTEATVRALKEKEGSDKVHETCGLPLSTYFASVKLRWMLDHVPAVKKARENKKLFFGTIDTWLMWNLTGGTNGGLHITDATNGSRTMLLNIRTLKYEQKLIDFFGFDGIQFPEVRSSSEVYGKIADGPGKGLTLAGILGDQSAALVGHCALRAGSAKNTYGTGCFLLFNTGEEPIISKNGLLTTVGYAFKGRKPVYALEGSIAVAGSAIQWARDKLGIIKEAKEIGELADQVKGESWEKNSQSPNDRV